MHPPPLRRLRNVAALVRTFSRLDGEQREALNLLARVVADENVRPRAAGSVHPSAYVSPFASLRFTERVEIGPEANVGPYACIWGGWSQTWARLERAAHVGTGAALVAGNHAWNEPGTVRDIGMDEADVVIAEGGVVSANATVVGCRVGRYALVGANSVVIKDVPDYAIVAGVPARVIGERPRVD